MELLPGIKIVTDSIDIETKFQINTGVIIGDNFDIYLEKKYATGAYKPKLDWRPLKNSELQLLIAASDRISSYQNIGFKKLPENIVHILKKLDLKRFATELEIKKAIGENLELIKELNEQLNIFLYSMLEKEEDLCFHKLVFTKPGLETLTYYPNKSENERQYIGLHVDKSEPIREQIIGTTRNRLCINLSEESRDLLIVNLTLTQVMSLLRKVESINEESIHIDNAAKLFFKYFPDYPVIKIKQEPYEYYLAPTDNFFHDGSTLNKTRIDYTMIYLGYFNLFIDEELLFESTRIN